MVTIGNLTLLIAALSLAGPAVARSGPERAPKSWTTTARLVGFECGDNCWLSVKDARGRRESVLCNAPQCERWMSLGTLPKRLVGKRVKMSMRMGKAMSGDVVMAESPEVFRLEFVN